MNYFNRIAFYTIRWITVILVLVVLSPVAFAQTTKTIGGTNPDFTGIADAVNWVNNTGNSISGGIIFTVVSGHTETAPSGGIVITREGTASDYIKFIKASGATANALITAPEGTGSEDAIITLNGADYITFDGIDIEESRTNNNKKGSPVATKRMEYGYLIKSDTSGTNGATNNIIKNCVITLNNANTNGAVGILQTANSFGGGTAAISAAGANSYNTYQDNTIQNATAGIYLLGTSASFPDLAANIKAVTTDNIVSDASSSGIKLSFQSGASVTSNIIKSIEGTGANTTSGIEFVNTAGINTVNKNQVQSVINANTSGIAYGINVTNTDASSVINIYNNTIIGVSSGNNTSSVIGISGIYITGSVAGTHNISFNSVLIDPSGNKCSNTCIQIGNVSTVNKISNNVFANFTGNQNAAKHYAIATNSTNAIGASGSVSSNNDLYINNTTNGYIGLAGTDKTTLADWQAIAAGMDANSMSTDPFFTSSTDLHTSSCRLKSRGVAITGITTDAFGVTRSNTPSIGVDEMATMVRSGTWVGATSNDWLTSTNWCDDNLPTQNINVNISRDYPNFPVVSYGIAEANNILIETGAKLTIAGGTLNYTGTLTKNGTFDITSGNLMLSGDSQVVPVTSVANLTITNSTTSIASDLTITGTLTLTGGGILNTDTNKIILDAAATLEENDTSYIIGTIEAQRTVATNTTESFGNIGISINAAGNAPGITTITRINTPSGIASNGLNQGIQRSYDIKPAVDTGLNATVVFKYLDSELNGITETSLQLYRSADTGKTWQYVSSTLDTGSNTMIATGIYAFSIWTGGSSLSPLPVNLVSFNAVRKTEKTAALSWKTVGELNNDRFEVERSADGINFTTIGTVSGNGTTTHTINYSFEDNTVSLMSAVLYYRLKQVDYNGAFEYSQIIRLSTAKNTLNPDIKAWYSGAEGKINLSATKKEAASATITLVDMQGRILSQQSAQFAKGSNFIQLDVQHLKNGIYSYLISFDNELYTGKMMKY